MMITISASVFGNKECTYISIIQVSIYDLLVLIAPAPMLRATVDPTVYSSMGHLHYEKVYKQKIRCNQSCIISKCLYF